MKKASASLRRQGGVQPRSRYPVGYDNGRQRDREGSKRCLSGLLYARQFKASRLRKAQQLMASSHARGKCSAGGGVPRSLSSRASFRAGRSLSQIPSFTAQAKRNSSWSPPASGCSFAKSSRHICRSSRNVGRSTFLAPSTRRTSCHLFRPFYVRLKYPVKCIIERAQPLEGRTRPHLHMWPLGPHRVATQSAPPQAHIRSHLQGAIGARTLRRSSGSTLGKRALWQYAGTLEPKGRQHMDIEKRINEGTGS
jgi:hypothetical protein